LTVVPEHSEESSMGRKRERDQWRDLIFPMKDEHSDWGAQRIGKQLAKEGKGDIPKRTVSRLLQDWLELNDEERAKYGFFRWPEAMEQGHLPWEASNAALELLGGWYHGSWGRPSIGLTYWFWRVTQAAPDAPFLVRSMAAKTLEWAVVLRVGDPALTGTDNALRAVEWGLTYAPWGSPEHKERYVKATGEGKIPDWTVTRDGTEISIADVDDTQLSDS
jgi:hypothetical protein